MHVLALDQYLNIVFSESATESKLLGVVKWQTQIHAHFRRLRETPRPGCYPWVHPLYCRRRRFCLTRFIAAADDIL